MSLLPGILWSPLDGTTPTDALFAVAPPNGQLVGDAVVGSVWRRESGAWVRRVNTATTSRDDAPEDFGLKAWTYSPRSCSTVLSISSLGRIHLSKIKVPYTITITNIVCHMQTAGITAATTGCYLGLYNSALDTVLAKSTDNGPGFTTAGMKTGTVSSTTITGGPGVYVYGALLINGTGGTPQVLVPHSGSTTALQNAGVSAAPNTGATCMVSTATNLTDLSATLVGGVSAGNLRLYMHLS